jgi:transcriptional regulator with XRE-family HTH domain
MVSKLESYLPVYHINQKMESAMQIDFCRVALISRALKMELAAQEKFAEVVCELRGARSYRSFAKLIGVSHPTIKAWEEMHGIPDTESLEKIAVLRGESLEEFRQYLAGTREPSQMQKIVQQLYVISDTELAILLRAIADRLEKSS